MYINYHPSFDNPDYKPYDDGYKQTVKSVKKLKELKMKTMTREEAILAMINGKEVTSDEFKNPDIEYCVYDKEAFYPFRFIDNTQNVAMELSMSTKVWRLRKYIPKDKELVWAYDECDLAYGVLRYYDAKNNSTFDDLGMRGGIPYPNYAQFDGTPPQIMCKKEDLED